MFSFLPEQYRNKAVIAGGYAACPALATDMDVWVLVRPEELNQARAAILGHLQQTQSPWVTLEEQSNVPEPEGTIRVTDPDYLHSVEFITRKVAKVLNQEPPVHIMVTTAEDTDQLLNSFDLSTHAVAIDSEGNVFTGVYWTSITELPEVLKQAPKTRERYQKLVQRYRPAPSSKGVD